jgi:hypothetical protein
MASKFIAEEELPRLLQAAEQERITILPVIIRPCSRRAMGRLADFQAVNSPAKPLADLGQADRDRVWIRLVEAMTAALGT